jgi:nitric oxide reductase NorE protein
MKVVNAETQMQFPDELPGDFAIWIFILAEMLVFGVLFVVYAFSRAHQVEIFNASQATLSRAAGAVNTLVLITSSYFVVRAVSAVKLEKSAVCARWLIAAWFLGGVFVAIKLWEFKQKIAAGIGPDSNDFYMFYFALTSFHFMHVVMGMIILAFVIAKARRGGYSALDHVGVETGASFWHMVDLLWIILFPLVYVIR